MMPTWLPFDMENKYTMCIDVQSELVSDYHKEAREFIEATEK